MLALVRRMMVVDDELATGEHAVSRKRSRFACIGRCRRHRHTNRAEFEATQSVYEWVMRRADLLAPRPEGLFGVQGGEREFQRTEWQGKRN